MASASQSVVARPVSRIAGRGGLLDRYFYLFLSLVVAGIVVAGFSRTVDRGLFHAAPPRPVLLWIHGAAFSGWVVLFIVQSALVRVRKVSVHRTLGWFGAVLGAMMVTLGAVVAVVMGRFDALQLHQGDPAFLSIPFFDMMAFGTLFGLAILWRGKPDWHRRFMVLATCGLLDAAFGRFDYLFNHGLFLLCVDAVMLLGVARDLLVDRRVHKVYLWGIPVLVVGQNVALYLWRGAPGWWVSCCKEILGI
jgi:FtsH-binding integral membrane protein